MEESKLLRVYEDLPSWARGIVIVGGLGIAYIVGTNIVKMVKAASSAADNAAKQNQIQNDLNKLNKNGVTPTYDDSQYESWADSIQGALQGCDYSFSIVDFGVLTTGGTAIWNVLKNLQNDADFLSLSKAYGSSRKVVKHWYCGYGDDVTGSMSSTLTRILNPYELGLINERLEKNGLKSKI
jgi:hypothetical protein